MFKAASIVLEMCQRIDWRAQRIRSGRPIMRGWSRHCGKGSTEQGARSRPVLPAPCSLLRAQVTFPIGKLRILFPVAAKIALHTAGAVGGTEGSPIPPNVSVLGTV